MENGYHFALRVLEWSLGNWVSFEGVRRLPRVDPFFGSGHDKPVEFFHLILNFFNRKLITIVTEIKMNLILIKSECYLTADLILFNSFLIHNSLINL